MSLVDDDPRGGNSSNSSNSTAPSLEMPLTIAAAIFWCVGATVGTSIFILLTRMYRNGLDTDLVNAVACQAAVYLVVILLVVRRHEGDRQLSSVFAFRRTHPGFYFLGFILGVCLQVPAELLQRLANRIVPIAPEALQMQIDMLRMDTAVSRLMIPFVAVVLGPFVEELLFRGVLFGGMRRCYGAVRTMVVVSLLFAGAHGSVQGLIPLLLVGGVVTFLRFASGSIIPCLVAHGVFNAVAVFAMAVGWLRLEGEAQPLPNYLSVGGVVASALIVGAIVALSRNSEIAELARQEDLA